MSSEILEMVAAGTQSRWGEVEVPVFVQPGNEKAWEYQSQQQQAHSPERAEEGLETDSSWRCPAKVTGSLAQLKCIYTNAYSMGNNQEDLEAIVQQENVDIAAISETWWDGSHNWGATLDGYKFFGRDRLRRRGGGIALYIRECFDCLEFKNGYDRIECLWIRIRGKTNEADVIVGSLL